MTFVDANSWNQIAKQRLKSAAAKVAFNLNDTQLAAMVDFWWDAERAAGMSATSALCLTTYLPLHTERAAIKRWTTEHPSMRDALPEILMPQAALNCAEEEHSPKPEEMRELEHALFHPKPHLERWLAAANAALAGTKS